MHNVETRLARCFSAVFPTLAPQEIVAAGSETVKGWDSIAAATLVAAIEEEFGIEFEVEALRGLTSFEAMLDYLTRLPALQ